MKKTVTVSLGGLVFCLEEDAYIKLDGYLKRLEAGFANEPDRREIMNDIEARIAEHFKEASPKPDDVINLSQVDRVIDIMGDPTDLGAEQKEYRATSGKPFNSTGKRLYRDPENSIIAGVSSGLSYYWNIDPVIIRILFVITALWGGGGFFVYVILWIVIPEARTAAERLEMTGEPVTAENIGKTFQGSSNQRK
ncbi:MAG: PspC domain-containing protein [Tenuifilaceae bacterium]|jgi:phage shock protein PspC (stress-responsive transcriptional regulator)|nr:PspC domain-containing protein [Tenuifilaceae bacterium]